MEDIQQVVKGGVSWLQMSVTRGRGGLNIWVKTDPRVEEFMAALGANPASDISIYGRTWQPVVAGKPLMVYELSQNIPATVGYTINAVAEDLRTGRDLNKVNLSFLRIKDIGSPDGVHFCVLSPMSKTYARDLSRDILAQTAIFIRDFIVPININLRISSQEV